MDLPIQWLERQGLLYGKKVPSVNASHLSHGPTSPMATAIAPVQYVIKDRESASSVHATSEHMSCRIHGACARPFTVYDVPAELLQHCLWHSSCVVHMSTHFVSYSVAKCSYILMTVMCMQLLHFLQMDSLRLASQCHAFDIGFHSIISTPLH